MKMQSGKRKILRGNVFIFPFLFFICRSEQWQKFKKRGKRVLKCPGQ